MSRASGWSARRRAGQAYVEYGLLVAVVGIVCVLALSGLWLAEQSYFVTLQPGVAPTPVATPSFAANDPTAIESVTCDTVARTCNAVVGDVAPMPNWVSPGGTLAFYDTSSGNFLGQCSVDTVSPPPPPLTFASSTCSRAASISGAIPPKVSAQFVPTPTGTHHLQSPITQASIP